MTPDSATRLSFGDVVFDTASGDLHRNGSVTRLAPQAAAVLTMLAGRRGDVVTRSELRDALWPDTTVEFDQGLNFCIRQLRVALADDAAEPKYIETLHRRGYRFVAPVAAAAVAEPGLPANEKKPARRSTALLIGATAIVVAVAVVQRMQRRDVTPAAPVRVAVLAFDLTNGATVAAYQGQLAELLVTAVGRGQLDRLAVMGPSFTSRFSGTATPPDSIRAALGATHVLSGTLRVDGNVVRVFAQVIRTSDRRHVWAGRFTDSIGAVSGSQIVSIADTIARAATNIVTRDRL